MLGAFVRPCAMAQLKLPPALIALHVGGMLALGAGLFSLSAPGLIPGISHAVALTLSVFGGLIELAVIGRFVQLALATRPSP